MFDMRNLRIGTRLIGTTLAALLLMLVFVGLALVSLGRIGDRVDHLTAHNGRLIELAVDLRMCNLLIERRVRTALLVEEIAAQGEERQKVDSDLARYAEDEAKLLALAGEPQEKASAEARAARGAPRRWTDLAQRTLAQDAVAEAARAPGSDRQPAGDRAVAPRGRRDQHEAEGGLCDPVNRIRQSVIWALYIHACACALSREEVWLTN